MQEGSLVGDTGGAKTPGTLTAQFVNYGSVTTGVPNVVYIAANPTTNKIDLQLALTSGSATLAPGPVVDPDALPPVGKQSLFYLDLSALGLTAAAWQKLTATATGFTCEVFPDAGVVGIAPSAATTLGTKPIAIHLGSLELDGPPSVPSPQLSVTYYNVPGVTQPGISLTANFAVAAQQPPSGHGDLTKVLGVVASPASVVNSRGAKSTVENTLDLQFSRKDPAVGVPAGPKTLFTISFVYGASGDHDGYGALTDVPEAKLITPVKGDHVDEWKVTPYLQAESPYWTLQPPNGEPIVPVGAVCDWLLTQVATSYQPGPTLMLVQYSGVPGYDNGVFPVVLTKVAHALVHSVTVTPNPAVLGPHGTADVTVSWDVDYATRLVLTQNGAPTDVTNQQSTPATLSAQSTYFTLEADGPGADVDNSDFGSTTALALPVINSFQGQPTEVWSGGGAHDVSLNWAVQTTGKVAIAGSGGQDYGDSFPAKGGTPVSVASAQMLTLSPVAETGVSAPSRNLVVGGYETLVGSAPLSAGAVAAVASPSAPFIACVTAAGAVIALDTVQYSPIASATATAGASPTGLAFSPDGSLLVVLNGDSTATLIGVTTAAGAPVFTVQQTLELGGGTPQAVIVTPDLATLYFSVDGTPGALVVATRSGTRYTVSTRLALGNAPRGMAMLPSGAQIFVANSDDDTITRIGIGLEGGLRVLTPTIQLSSTGKPAGIRPTGLAVTVTAAGSALLAACPGSGVVWALDAINPNGGRRQSLTVGAKPRSVAVTPSGAYAFVANSGDGTLSLLDVWGGVGQCAVVGSPLKTAVAPQSISVSPDGLVVIASDPGTAKLAIVTLALYAERTVATDVGVSPTNVVVDGDGSAALVWMNGLIAGRQVPGVRYYALGSGVSTEMLSDISPVACAFVPGTPTMFAIGAGSTTLYDVDLTDPTNPVETDIDLGGSAATVGLGLVGDGTSVLVVTAGGGQYTLLVGAVAGQTWTTKQTLPLYTGSHSGPVTVVATPDGSTAFVADAQNQQLVTLTRGKDGKYARAHTQPTAAYPVSVAISPDGTTAWVLSATTPDTITVVDVTSLTTTTASTFQSYVNLRALALSPDGRFLFAPDLSAAALRIIDPRSLRILQTTPLAGDLSQAQGASAVAIAPDGSQVFVVNKQSGSMSVLAQYPL